MQTKTARREAFAPFLCNIIFRHKKRKREHRG